MTDARLVESTPDLCRGVRRLTARPVRLVAIFLMGVATAGILGASLHPGRWRRPTAPPKPGAFEAEVAAGESAPDRDSRVEHLRRELSLRPGHRDNMHLEFNIGIELTQRDDPVRGQHPQPAEGLKVFRHIIETYKHMDYYSPDPVDRSNSPQMTVPAAAILATGIERAVNGDPARSRDDLIFAMKRMEETYHRRVKDWKAPHVEPPPGPFTSGPIEESKRKSREAMYAKRQADAAKGDVFGTLEMSYVDAAVRQYGYSYGRQKPSEVAPVMDEIIKLFSGTPMAKVAEAHKQRAAAVTTRSR